MRRLEDDLLAGRVTPVSLAASRGFGARLRLGGDRPSEVTFASLGVERDRKRAVIPKRAIGDDGVRLDIPERHQQRLRLAIDHAELYLRRPGRGRRWLRGDNLFVLGIACLDVRYALAVACIREAANQVVSDTI